MKGVALPLVVTVIVGFVLSFSGMLIATNLGQSLTDAASDSKGSGSTIDIAEKAEKVCNQDNDIPEQSAFVDIDRDQKIDIEDSTFILKGSDGENIESVEADSCEQINRGQISVSGTYTITQDGNGGAEIS